MKFYRRNHFDFTRCLARIRYISLWVRDSLQQSVVIDGESFVVFPKDLFGHAASWPTGDDVGLRIGGSISLNAFRVSRC